MPYTSDNPEPVRESDQTVRFYFSVSVLCLIPPNPHGARDSVLDAKWEKNRLERVEADLKARLSMVGFDAAYREHMLVDEARRLYVARFAVSAPCSFSAAQVFTARKGYSGFRGKKTPLLKAKAIQETKIRDALKRDYVVNAISYEYAASWSFVYEVYMGGIVELKHDISPSEISAAGGSVRDAIEYFNSEVADALEPRGFIVTPKTTARRPKNNVYKFDLYLERCFVFSEEDVSGDLVLLDKGMPLSEAGSLGIDCDDDALRDRVSSARIELECCDFPQGSDVIQITLDFVDYDEELYDYSNDLV
ncbi:hypothetical protein [Paraburkholderia bannensis]|uniref:hypothetical protein n=1 Tax=Paraburkholderia bannensis TaxID=765414 RepID=UPI002ABE770D|nr:hypothetical protein [Paraburkholderia bannensis]